ncbi:MAG: hypothetical protein ABIT96_08015 [Ferruginibacter sp.]
MKKLTTILAACLLIAMGSAFAANPEPGKDALRISLNKNFTNASDITWKEKDGIYFAYFIKDNKDRMAAFDENANLIAESRDIKATDMPLAVSRSLEKQFSSYSINSPVSEIPMQGSTSYCFILENSKASLLVKCASNGSVEVVKKTKK